MARVVYDEEFVHGLRGANPFIYPARIGTAAAFPRTTYYFFHFANKRCATVTQLKCGIYRVRGAEDTHFATSFLHTPGEVDVHLAAIEAL